MAITSSRLTGFDFEDQSIYIPVRSIHLGGMTKFTLQKLLNEGDITERTHNDIFATAQVYFKAALDYVLQKFPLTDKVLQHAKLIDVVNPGADLGYFISSFQPCSQGTTMVGTE